MSKLKGLGRGLDALLAGSGAKAEEELRKLPVELCARVNTSREPGWTKRRWMNWPLRLLLRV